MSLREELGRFHSERARIESQTFEMVVDKCVHQIKYENEHGRMDTCFVVPTFLIGRPIYDVGKCVSYVLKHLKKQNLRCTNKQNRIFISWRSVVEGVKTPDESPPPPSRGFDHEDVSMLCSLIKKK